MGINLQSLRLLLHEDQYQSIQGTLLTLGYNTVTIPPERLQRLCNEYNKILPVDWISKGSFVDLHTKHARKVDYPCFDQNALLSVLFPGIDKINVLDVSAYEGADIVFNLNNTPPPDEMCNSFDFIYDGSVLDNIFNPANALSSLHYLLRSGGRFAGINIATDLPGAMTAMSPEFFYSFFSINDYSDIKIYAAAVPNRDFASQYCYSCDWFRYQPSFTPSLEFNAAEAAFEARKTYGMIHCVFIAQKGLSGRDALKAPIIKHPVNLQYLDNGAIDWTTREAEFVLSKRPIVNLEIANIAKLLYSTDHYIYCGNDNLIP